MNKKYLRYSWLIASGAIMYAVLVHVFLWPPVNSPLSADVLRAATIPLGVLTAFALFFGFINPRQELTK